MKFAIVFGIFVILVGALFVYFRTWRHIPENFAPAGYTVDASGNLVADPTINANKVKPTSQQQDASGDVIMDEVAEPPYAQQPINNLDDYEYSMIFQNEGDRAMTKATRDYLMSQYPMDWSVQPPSSQQFQNGLADFKEASKTIPAPINKSLYNKIDGSNMIPPDTLAAEQKERDILATYVPKKPGALTTYDAEDAKALIEKIYDAKGVVPIYKQTGDNQFTVMSTMPKNQKVVWEDEIEQPAAATTEANPSAGEGVIIVPPVAQDVAAGLDPFFTPGQKTRDGKWDYTQWTPGLERMFAPNDARTHWY